MKKLIAILTIAIVLVGAIFADPTNSTLAQGADGNAYIDIKTTIAELIPTFQLATNSGVTAESAQTDTAATDSTHAQYGILTSTESAKLLNENGKAAVSFVVNQVGVARTTAGYTFTVTAGDLELTNYATNGATTLEANEKFTVVDSTPNLAPIDDITKTVGNVTFTIADFTHTADTNTMTVRYSGIVPAQKIADFTVEWNANLDAVSGDYVATVQLEVSSL